MTTMSTHYTLTDGNAHETYDTLAKACSAAEDWYGYMIDQADGEVSDELGTAIHSAAFFADSVEALNAAIGEWEARIAEACGKKDFHGHGSYRVSAADQMGLSLVCRVEHRCESGQATGDRCEWSGDASEMTTIEWMPTDLRASHEAAGNSGVYPGNGALRLRCCPDCAEMLTEDEE